MSVGSTQDANRHSDFVGKRWRGHKSIRASHIGQSLEERHYVAYLRVPIECRVGRHAKVGLFRAANPLHCTFSRAGQASQHIPDCRRAIRVNIKEEARVLSEFTQLLGQ